MSLSTVSTPPSFTNIYFIYEYDGQIYIGFGQKNELIESSSFIKKLGWDGDDWVVKNKNMKSKQYRFEKCDWDEINRGEIGFASNLDNIRKGDNTFKNQIDYLDNYFIKCDNEYLVHIIDKDMWNSASKCKKWIGDYCFYKLVTE